MYAGGGEPRGILGLVVLAPTRLPHSCFSDRGRTFFVQVAYRRKNKEEVKETKSISFQNDTIKCNTAKQIRPNMSCLN